MTASRLHSRVAVLFGTLAVLAFAVVAHATTYQVTMGTDDRFHPEDLTISVGDSVYWSNLDTDAHTSTSGGTACSPNGLWDSGDVLLATDWGRTFNIPGVLPYFCMHHCAFGMTGTITVLQPTPVTRSAWGAIKSLYR